jgi:hypothetical protein
MQPSAGRSLKKFKASVLRCMMTNTPVSEHLRQKELSPGVCSDLIAGETLLSEIWPLRPRISLFHMDRQLSLVRDRGHKAWNVEEGAVRWAA